jgi:hypothetical protein
MTQKSTLIYQIKVTLNDIRPPIWRRILVPENYSLFKLHNALQRVMGWDNYHLHHFIIDNEFYGDPADDEYGDLGTRNEKNFKLNKIIYDSSFKFIYEYDFGDSWEHSLLVEKILPAEKGVHYPICIKGKRACPPEDVGGAWGYESFLEALRDPKNPEHDEYLEWVGGEFDPEAFDLEEINQALRHPMQESRTGAYPIPEDEFSPETQRLSSFDSKILENLFTPDNETAAEKLALRQDVVALLAYLQENKITGTQATGNLPLKAVEQIAARLVNPPKLEETIGDHTHRFRNETEVWSVYFVHILAAVDELVNGGQSRRWRLTPTGEQFLAAPAIIQTSMLLAAWWWKVNWIIAFPFSGIGESLPEQFKESALGLLIQLPGGTSVPYGSYAERLIKMTGLHWSKPELENANMFLHSAVERMIISPLAIFGVIIPEYKTVQRYGMDFQELVAFQVTPFGESILKTLDIE